MINSKVDLFLLINLLDFLKVSLTKLMAEPLTLWYTLVWKPLSKLIDKSSHCSTMFILRDAKQLKARSLLFLENVHNWHQSWETKHPVFQKQTNIVCLTVFRICVVLSVITAFHKFNNGYHTPILTYYNTWQVITLFPTVIPYNTILFNWFI